MSQNAFGVNVRVGDDTDGAWLWGGSWAVHFSAKCSYLAGDAASRVKDSFRSSIVLASVAPLPLAFT
jgi:hypothetical protein